MPFGSQWLETEAACESSQEDSSAHGRKEHGGRHGARWFSVVQGIRRSLDVHLKSYYKVDSAFATAARYASASDKLRVLARALTDTGLVDFCCVYLVHPTRGTFGVAALSGAGSELYPPLLTQAANLGAKLGADVCASTPALNVFTRSVFQVQDSNWAVEDVVASKAPWYYDCASAVNGFGLPQEAAWLRRVGMRSVLALPCMASAQAASPASALGLGQDGCGSAVTGVLTVATRQKTLDHLLLRKLEELCCRLAPIVADAVSEHARVLSNRRLVGRYESVSDFAHAVLGEMLNLDRAVAVSVAASNVVAAGSATGLTPSAARQAQRQNSIAARSCSGSKHAPAATEARFDAAAAVEAAKAAGFGWTAPASSVTPTSASASTKTSGFASCLARLRSKGHGSKAAAAAAAAAASSACTNATSATCGTTAAPTSPTCASTPTTATSGATPCSQSNALQQSSQEAVWSASFSTSPSQQQQLLLPQQQAPACAAAAATRLQQLHAADTFCSATSRAGTACGLSSGAGGLSTAVTAADGLPSAVMSSALLSGGAPCKAAAISEQSEAGVATTLDVFQSLTAAVSLPLPVVCTAVSVPSASPTECGASDEHEEQRSQQQLRCMLGASGTARTLPARPAESITSVRDLMNAGAFTSGLVAAPTTAPAHSGAASAMAASCADALALEAAQTSRSTRSLSCLEFSAGGLPAAAAEALGSCSGNSNSSGMRSGRCGGAGGASAGGSPTAAAACARAHAAAQREAGLAAAAAAFAAGANADAAARAVHAHVKYDSNGSPFCGAVQLQHHQQSHQVQQRRVAGPDAASTDAASERSSGDDRDFLYGRDAGYMMDDSSMYGSGEWRSGIAPGGTGAGASRVGCGSYMLPNSAYSSRGGSCVMHRGVPIEPSIGPISTGLYGSGSAAAGRAFGLYGSAGSTAGRGFGASASALAAAAASAAATPYLSPVRFGGGASACASERSMASHDTTATLATTTFASSVPMGGYGAGTSTAQLMLSVAGHCGAGAPAAGSTAGALDLYVCAAASAAPDCATTTDGGCDAAAAAAARAAGPASRWSRDSATAAAAMWGSEASDAIAAAMHFTAGAAPAPLVPSSSQGAVMSATQRMRGGCAVPLGGISGAGQLFGIRESGPMPSASTLIGSGSGGLPRGCRSAGSASASASNSGSASGSGSGPCGSGDMCLSITDMASPPGMAACDGGAAKNPAAVACKAAAVFNPAAATSRARW
ncbi:hypothetical protein HXX76_003630 [Chlamydomonas incerta]|uniref:Uncharacterized protein n=1 Tax=Chlamydomonas incerta TaxID=51695 RepID=A0A835W828_CHLIN|nr:hypothetical protein HXX76_003630 [Chlamydomonas incerta]|eukprot:KAG2440774.1 hypothetical protein HXX76_003630 [Chlamydomonas incerta]